MIRVVGRGLSSRTEGLEVCGLETFPRLRQWCGLWTRALPPFGRCEEGLREAIGEQELQAA